MDTATATAALSSSTVPSGTRAETVASLGSADFLKLLIAELTNQDPFEPTDNKDLLNQISSIRDIELSTSLTQTLQGLMGQQQYASAASMIGKYVTGIPDSDGNVARGFVQRVRFEEGGVPALELSDGTTLPVPQVATIESADDAAQSLVGREVVGIDRREASEPEVVEGRVTAVRGGKGDPILLELDTGEDLRLSDVRDARNDGT